ncbi:hypothetical protein [Mammaliicoccus stepanovicii]|uniref:Uncharacterized protein n=1 Tax=Mammaliicoccus stepanovicii TaxID=643214 RepID=A0A240A4U7_9STAP|nr:hypothetical protein [Mammaliicoccus stepanovicii]PNZ71899.1 hypothetical protein CD111_11530 [Mammaliicoccus stepanovicii]GGI39491.1 hypothetical protein GCM10010896_03650 [Mammaliicoccus stepanovicii]SNV78170.1 Uncharacterised protein [Mammaliicoccus stepanovicii]
MNNLKGSFSIIFKDLRLQIYTFTIVLLVLAGVYVAIAIFNELENFKPVISGPIIGILGFMPLFLFGDPFKASIELGATRKQYILSAWISYIIFVFIMLAIHELIIFIIDLMTKFTDVNLDLARIGDLVPNINGFDYAWIDFLTVMFLAGICFLVAAIIYRVGIIPTLIGLFAVGVVIFVWIVVGDVNPLVNWVFDHAYQTFHILGLAGLISALLIYPLMIRVTLKD